MAICYQILNDTNEKAVILYLNNKTIYFCITINAYNTNHNIYPIMKTEVFQYT